MRAKRGERPIDSIVIAPAIMSDAPGLLSVQRLAYESEARLYNDWTIAPLQETEQEVRLALAASAVRKAVIRRRLVGSVRARPIGRTVEISRLAVHPAFQRRGIGGRLLAAVEATFTTPCTFVLFTGARSLDNVRFYKDHGYHTVKQEQVSERLTLVYMSKDVGRRAGACLVM